MQSWFLRLGTNHNVKTQTRGRALPPASCSPPWLWVQPYHFSNQKSLQFKVDILLLKNGGNLFFYIWRLVRAKLWLLIFGALMLQAESMLFCTEMLNDHQRWIWVGWCIQSVQWLLVLALLTVVLSQAILAMFLLLLDFIFFSLLHSPVIRFNFS